MNKVQVNNMITPSPATDKMTDTVILYQMNTTIGNLVPRVFFTGGRRDEAAPLNSAEYNHHAEEQFSYISTFESESKGEIFLR